MVVLLFDGFAPSLIDAVRTPTLTALHADGAWTDHLVPVFPTITHLLGIASGSPVDGAVARGLLAP